MGGDGDVRSAPRCVCQRVCRQCRGTAVGQPARPHAAFGCCALGTWLRAPLPGRVLCRSGSAVPPGEVICPLGPAAGPGWKSTRLGSGCQLLLGRQKLFAQRLSTEGEDLNAVEVGVCMGRPFYQMPTKVTIAHSGCSQALKPPQQV